MKETKNTPSNKNSNRQKEIEHFFHEKKQKGFFSEISVEAIPFFQTKLNIGQTNDKYEQEANALSNTLFDYPNEQAGVPAKKLTPVSTSAMIQTQKNNGGEEEAATTTSSDKIFIIRKSNANKRKDDDTHVVITKQFIPRGTLVKVIETGKDAKGTDVGRVEFLNDSSKKSWTTKDNYEEVKVGDDTEKYFISFNDTFIYKDPYSKKKVKITTGDNTENKTVVANTEVRIVCEKGNFVYISDASGTALGWIQKFNLYDEKANDRKDYLKKYKEWLEARLIEINALKGQTKLDRIKGHLSQIERTCNSINSGVYPKLDEMEKSPAYSANTVTSFAPPEIIGTVRSFIKLAEKEIKEKKEGATEETELATSSDKIPGGSLYSRTDWNSRLGVPQYRTQSDNIAAPEASCAPTSFSMATERLGSSRETIIQAINERLTDGHNRNAYLKEEYLKTEEGKKAQEEATKNEKEVEIPKNYCDKKITPADYSAAIAYDSKKLDELWEKKVKKYLKSSHMQGSSLQPYQKMRHNKGGLVGKEAELAKKYKEIAQLEDLVDFYHWLMDYGARTSINSGNYQKMYNRITNPNFVSSNDSVKKVTQLWSWSPEARSKIKATLESGGAVVMSIKHKGRLSGTHNVSVQAVTESSLIIDDPYGKINPDYRKNSGKKMDMYLPAGKELTKSVRRTSYTYKNVPSYDSSETDYTKRDFTATAAQNLVDNEKRGDSTEISFEMLNESKSEIINYIVLYPKM